MCFLGFPELSPAYYPVSVEQVDCFGPWLLFLVCLFWFLNNKVFVMYRQSSMHLIADKKSWNHVCIHLVFFIAPSKALFHMSERYKKLEYIVLC